MKGFSLVLRTCFLVLAAMSCFLAMASPTSAEGFWLLEDDWSEDKPDEVKPGAYYHSYKIQTGATSGTQSGRFGPGSTYKETGGFNCQGSWTSPPRTMTPGQEISFTSNVSIAGSDSRGGYYLFHGCKAGCLYVSTLNSAGDVVGGSGCGIELCKTGIGGGQKTSDSCSVTSVWKVPGGSPGSGLILYLGMSGNAGTGRHAFKYLFQEGAVPEETDDDSSEPHHGDDTGPGYYDGPGEPAPDPSCPADYRLNSPQGLTSSSWISPGQRVKEGVHTLWVGQSNRHGAPPTSWKTHSPYRLEGGATYLVTIRDFGTDMPQIVKNAGELTRFPTPPDGFAVVYYRVETTGGEWAGTCLERLGPLTLGNTRPGVIPQAPCVWDTFSPQGRSDTPGLSIGDTLPRGRWWLWIADAGTNGLKEPDAWTRHGPFVIEDEIYLFRITAFEDPDLIIHAQPNPARALPYTTPGRPRTGRTFFEVDTIARHWAAVCFTRAASDPDSNVSAPSKPVTESNHNKGGVASGPKSPTTFTFEVARKLLFLGTYHWNYGRGTASPGRIGLRRSDGAMFGPWQAQGRAGQGDVPNAYWEVRPNVILNPGTYTVTDSEDVTWATNAEASWQGFATIRTGDHDHPDETAP